MNPVSVDIESIRNFQAYFFDFDGVIVDSVDIKTHAFAELFSIYGNEIVNKVVEYHVNNIGISRTDKFRHFYSKFIKKPLYDEKLSELSKTFSKIVVDKVVSALEIPGAEHLLSTILKAGRPCFVVSAVPEKEIQLIVRRRQLTRYFDEVVGVPASKTENIKMLINAHGLSPQRCIFFGDSEGDYRAAHSCKVNFLGVIPNPDAHLLKIAPEIIWTNHFNHDGINDILNLVYNNSCKE